MATRLQTELEALITRRCRSVKLTLSAFQTPPEGAQLSDTECIASNGVIMI